MPEGDTIFRAARTLNLALAGQPVTAFESVLPHLSRVDVDSGIVGRTVEKVQALGKWMLIYFSGDLILLSHMLMSGSWHIYRPGEQWKRKRSQMRVVISTPKILAVAFNVPVAEFHTSASLVRRPGFNSLGPSVLAPQFNEVEAITRLRSRPELEIGVALLSQFLLSGIGNVFKSEICFMCGINPFRLVNSLTEDQLQCLVSQARKFMLANVTESSGDAIVTYVAMRRTTNRSNPSERLWVYRRTGEPCRRCGGAITSRKQGFDARTSFWCPQCQPAALNRATAHGD
ncbi:MAG: Fpg/Nei family DNA glycosylase [Acidobacteriota bacterium]|nr:Fpg/Nei family DNA glycosylase [Acidobacteriota bacterium]